MTYQILQGDCMERLLDIPEGSIDAVVTDPPYGLGFMNKDWDIGVPSADLFRLCLRAMKPGAHLLAFGGSRTYHRLAVAVEDAGFEIRDQIMWLYGSGFPKSRNIGKEVGGWEGWGTALKPAHEPIVVARKPFKGTVAANVLAHGTGVLNIDGCRVGTEGARNNGRKVDSDIYGKFGPTERVDYGKGRWPANLIHDGSEEVLARFPESSVTGKRSDRSRAASVEGTAWLSSNHQSTEYADKGSAARFFYCAKASKRDRDEGLEDLGLMGPGRTCFDSKYHEGGGKLPSREGNHHPTVKPTELMRYLCRLVTPPGGTVLDPFMGSGSTGKAAVLEGFDFIGVEIDSDYAEIADHRIRYAMEVLRARQLDLLGEPMPEHEGGEA